MNQLIASMKLFLSGDGGANVKEKSSYFASLFDWFSPKAQASLFGVKNTHKSNEFEILSSRALWIHACLIELDTNAELLDPSVTFI